MAAVTRDADGKPDHRTDGDGDQPKLQVQADLHGHPDHRTEDRGDDPGH